MKISISGAIPWLGSELIECAISSWLDMRAYGIIPIPIDIVKTRVQTKLCFV